VRISPYRQNAFVEAPQRPRGGRVAVRAAMAVLTALAVAYGLVPEHKEVDLATAREALPAHAPIAAVAWNDDASRGYAVGARGEVYARALTWTRIPSDTTEDLFAVAAGDGPMLGGVALFEDATTGGERVFAVGAHGTLLDCSDEWCGRLATGVEAALRAVAVDGGQAVVVGDGGVILDLEPDGAAHRRGDPDLRRVAIRSPQSGMSADLRAVTLDCRRGSFPTCTAVAVGDHGAIVEGTSNGRCDDGGGWFSLSYSQRPGCGWSWRVARAPTDDAFVSVVARGGELVAFTRGGARYRREGKKDWDSPGTWTLDDTIAGAAGVTAAVRVSVHVAQRRLWRRGERSVEGMAVLGPASFVSDEAGWTPLGGRRFVAGASVRTGGDTLLVDAAGDVFRAR
jgi:hypothetical protein